MKKVRVELDLVLEIDMDTDDEDKAMMEAELIAIDKLYDNHGKCVLDDEDVYMANAAAKSLLCEDVDYLNGD